VTSTQIYTVAVLGGLTVVIGLVAFIGLSLAVHAGFARLAELRETRRERRRTLRTCQAIDALGTTTHPTES